ncbi:DUF3983 domain-containing protein [Bacillus albus]
MRRAKAFQKYRVENAWRNIFLYRLAF